MKAQLNKILIILALVVFTACNPPDMPLLQIQQSLISYAGGNALTPDEIVTLVNKQIKQTYSGIGRVTIENAYTMFECMLGTCVATKTLIEIAVDPLNVRPFNDDENSVDYFIVIDFKANTIQIKASRTKLFGYPEETWSLNAWSDNDTYFAQGLKLTLQEMDTNFWQRFPKYTLSVTIYPSQSQIHSSIYSDPENSKSVF